MVLIIKRKGKKENFDEKKLYGSVYAACASADYSEKKCEKTAGEITKKVRSFLVNKKQINSMEIRKKIHQELIRISKELAFFYEHHLPNLKKL
jgi:transcriptional regulator NrdR family protein